MTYSFSLRPADDLDEGQRSAMRAMKQAVYPPEDFADDPVRLREWRSPQWWLLVTDGDDQVVSSTGIVLVAGKAGEASVRIGGVGGIATHPDHRGRGLAANSIDIALQHLADNGAAFAMLVCRDELVGYYEALGWRLFGGTTLDRQRGEMEVFTFNRVMVTDVVDSAPDEGTIDVDGPLW